MQEAAQSMIIDVLNMSSHEKLFHRGGCPSTANYLFLGDYIDRGRFNLETILLLLAYKVRFPKNFFLLRGNHVCQSVNSTYGFHDEIYRAAVHKFLHRKRKTRNLPADIEEYFDLAENQDEIE